MEKLQQHIDSLQTKALSTAEPDFVTSYIKGQLLCTQGEHSEALKLYQSAFEEVRHLKDDFLWERMYISIGAAYAQTLDYLSMIDLADQIYGELIDAAPNGFFIGDYAVFLHRRKRDFNQAQAFYSKSLQYYPFQSSIHLKYAGFLRHVRKEMNGAEHHYKLAVETNPLSSEALGSYASYLHGVKGDIESAEGYYEKAVAADGTHTNNLCNFGLFLSEEKAEYERAESLYRQALDVAPKHANTLYNYAVMLDTHCKRKDEAEALYRRALEVEPKHSYALYNLAVLLEEKYNKIDSIAISGKLDADLTGPINDREARQLEVCKLYKRAVDADPHDATAIADYGRYLYTKMKDPDEAEPVLNASLLINPNCEVALYNLSLLLQKARNDTMGATLNLRKLLKVSPKHPPGLIQLARVLVEQHKTAQADAAAAPLLEEAFEVYEKAISLQKDPSATAVEYLKAVTALGTPRHQVRTIAVLDRIMQSRPVGGVARERDIQQLLEGLKTKSKDP